MTTYPAAVQPTSFAAPRKMIIDGIPLLVCLPAQSAPQPLRHPARCDQPSLPFDHTDLVVEAQLTRATSWVSALAQRVSEVLQRRRPIAHLVGILDAESCQHLDALVRLGSVQPLDASTPRLQASTTTRIEAWFSYRIDAGHLATAVTLEEVNQRWICTAFRILAPGAHAHTAWAA